MTKVAYVECFSGISGDMLLGALVDAGARLSRIEEAVSSLFIRGVSIGVERVSRGGLSASLVSISAREEPAALRTLRDIEGLLEREGLSRRVAEIALAAFRKLAAAEARIHGVPLEEVHFHELGAVDSIVDIVGVASALADLGIEQVYASPVNVGGGMVISSHGQLPVPAPAALELFKGIPIYSDGTHGELATPTGAALLSVLVRQFGPFPPMTVEAVGYGAGERDKATPNVVRVAIGESTEIQDNEFLTEALVVLETDIDDMLPEHYEGVFSALAAAGALDTVLIPTVMKKGRPGVRVSVLCRQPDAERVMEAMFMETTSFGIRRHDVLRSRLESDFIRVSTEFGPVTVRVGRYRGRIVTFKPEHAECAQLARGSGVSLKEVYAAAIASARRSLFPPGREC